MEENKNLNIKPNDIEEQKDKIEYVSYSHIDTNGVFRETIGYREENTAKQFFDSLSEEELGSLKRR